MGGGSVAVTATQRAQLAQISAKLAQISAGLDALQRGHNSVQAASVGASWVQPATAAVTSSPSAMSRIRSAATSTIHRVGATATNVNKYFSSHISQFRNAYNTTAPGMIPNCGPASVTIALRLIGLDVPGFSGQKTEQVLDKARVIATGKNDTRVGTTDTELERVIQSAGARFTESKDLGQITSWVKQGVPVILAGNPGPAWDKRFSQSQVYGFNGGHWVTVSGYNSSTGNYIVNDPLSAIGPIEVTSQELSKYAAGNSGLGIAVFK